MKEYRLQELLTIFVLSDSVSKDSVIAFFRNAQTQDLIFADSKEEALLIAESIKTPTIIISDYIIVENTQ